MCTDSGQRKMLGALLYDYSSNSRETESSLKLELGWQLASLSDLPVPLPSSAGVISVPNQAQLFPLLFLKVVSVVLNSGPHVCVGSDAIC